MLKITNQPEGSLPEMAETHEQFSNCASAISSRQLSFLSRLIYFCAFAFISHTKLIIPSTESTFVMTDVVMVFDVTDKNVQSPFFFSFRVFVF